MQFLCIYFCIYILIMLNSFWFCFIYATLLEYFERLVHFWWSHTMDLKIITRACDKIDCGVVDLFITSVRCFLWSPWVCEFILFEYHGTGLYCILLLHRYALLQHLFMYVWMYIQRNTEWWCMAIDTNLYPIVRRYKRMEDTLFADLFIWLSVGICFSPSLSSWLHIAIFW